MKRFALLLTFTLVLILTAVPVLAAQTRVIEDFDSFKDETSYDDRVFVWEGGGDFKLSLSTRRADKGKSLRVIPYGTGADDFGVINIVVPDKLQNWEGAEGIRFWAEATGGTVEDPTFIGLEVAFDDSHVEGHDERFIGYRQKPYTLAHADGNKEIRRFGDDGRVILDDGFKGWVEIPFDSFECAGWSMYDDTLHLDKVTKIFFGAPCGFARDKEVYIDSITIYGSKLADIKPDPTATPKPTEKPSTDPTEEPSAEPTEEPTTEPTQEPNESEEPVDPVEETPRPEPSKEPTAEPTEEPGESQEPEPTDEDQEPVDETDQEEKGGGKTALIVIGILLALATAGAATYYFVLRKK